MKSMIVLVYLFYSLTSGVAHNFYYRPKELHYQTQVRHSPNDRAFNNQQKKTEAIFHPWGQPQRNDPTVPSIQQHAGFVFRRGPNKKPYPTHATKQKQRPPQQYNDEWFSTFSGLPEKLANQVPTLPAPQLQRYRNPPWSQPRNPNPQSSRANYQKVLKELGLETVPPATLNTPVEKKKTAGFFGSFFHPIKPKRPAPRPQQRNHVAPATSYQSYKQGILNKNHRDDKTHEPYWNSRNPERDDNLEGFHVERTDAERAPISDHEYPKDIPTRPIYPGEGKWAKKGVKHRPYISTQKYSNLADDDDNIGRRPEGYDVFLEAEKIFEDQENVFKKGINAPRHFSSYPRPEDVTDWNAQPKKKQPIEDFVPQQLYAQVRKTEEDLYLPRSREEPKLTEEINDSKTHTIYTEEGYEDSAYDHAGHEKKAEVDEADHHAKDKIKTRYPKKYTKDLYIPPPDDDVEDDDGASSETSKTISNIRSNVHALAGDDEEEDEDNGGEDTNMAGTDGEAMMTIMKPAAAKKAKGKPTMVVMNSVPAGDSKKLDSKMAADKPMVTIMDVVPPADNKPVMAAMDVLPLKSEAEESSKPMMLIMDASPVQATNSDEEQNSNANSDPIMLLMHAQPVRTAAADDSEQEVAGTPMMVLMNAPLVQAEAVVDEKQNSNIAHNDDQPMMYVMNAMPAQHEVVASDDQQDSSNAKTDGQQLMYLMPVQPEATGSNEEQGTTNARSDGQSMMFLMHATPVETEAAEEIDEKIVNGTVSDSNPMMYLTNTISPQSEEEGANSLRRSDDQPVMYLVTTTPVQQHNDEEDAINATHIPPEVAGADNVERHSNNDNPPMMFLMHATPVQTETHSEGEEPSNGEPMMFLMNPVPIQEKAAGDGEEQESNNVVNDDPAMMYMMHAIPVRPKTVPDGEKDDTSKPMIDFMEAVPALMETSDDGAKRSSNNSESDHQPMMMLRNADQEEEKSSSNVREDGPPKMVLIDTSPTQNENPNNAPALIERSDDDAERSYNNSESVHQPMMVLRNAEEEEENSSSNVSDDGPPKMVLIDTSSTQNENHNNGRGEQKSNNTESDSTALNPPHAQNKATSRNQEKEEDRKEEEEDYEDFGNDDNSRKHTIVLTSVQQETVNFGSGEQDLNNTEIDERPLSTLPSPTEATRDNQEEDSHTTVDVPMMTLMKTTEEDKTTETMVTDYDDSIDENRPTTTEEPFPTFPTQPTLPTPPPPRRLVKRDLEAQSSDTQLSLEGDSSENADNMRMKRYTIDFANVDIDTSFLDKLLAHGRRPRKRKPDLTRIKYPYYNAPGLPENSPLRYAENLNNIPKKREGNFAFYAQADRRKRCADVEEDVDPVPDRVKNAEDEEATDVAELADVPRLEGLGDNIDCFKAKYFGEDPFDSPIFKEEYIDPPQPIFNDLIDVDVNSAEDISASEIFSSVVKDNEIKESNEPAPTVKQAAPEQSEIVQSAETVKTTVPSLITTPSYTVKLTPKHIYDQIHLLDYLPISKNNENVEAITTEASATEVVSVEEAATNRVTETTSENMRNPKALPLQTQAASNSNENTKEDDPQLVVIAINERSDSEQPAEVETTTASQVVEETPSTESAEVMPKAQPLRKVRRRKRPRPQQANKFEIFDINDFLPPPLPSQFTFVDQPQTKTKQKQTSEVQYKEEIKPSEQLNVFEDVINNIRSTPAETTQKPQTVLVNGNPSYIRRVKKVKPNSTRNKIRIQTPMTDTETAGSENIENVGNGVAVDDPATNYPQFGEKKPTRSVESSVGVNDNVPPGHHKVYKPVGQNVDSLSQTGKTPVSEETTSVPNKDNIEEQATQVLGLVPPDNWQYKTIYNTDNPEKQTNLTNLNTYPVAGMKPPPANQKVITYADFKTKTPVRRVHHHLVKRDALRSRYTEIKRTNNKNKTETEKDQADDYVPRRPTSFHYDVEQDRIVYNRKPSYQSDEESSATRRNTISTTTTTPIPTTTKKPEMNWFEYIKLLKSNDKYMVIPEPKSTEKPESTTMTTAPVLINEGTISTPEFLSLIAKLKQDKNYMIIEEPKDSKKKSTTTTKAPQTNPEVEAEESIDTKNVQNSPGGQIFEMLKEKVDDNTDPGSTVKNYTPKTVIDTSKYKTIERPRVSTTTEEVSIADRRMDSTNPLEESEAQLSTPEVSSQAPTTTEPTSKPKRILNSKLSGTLRAPSSPRPTTKSRRPSSIYARTTTPRLSTTTIPTVETTKTFFKRRMNRTRVQITTEKNHKESDGETTKNRTLTRRHEPDVPMNHKPVFTPLLKPTQGSALATEGTNQVNIQVTPRTLTPDILYQTENLTSSMKKHEIRPRKVADVEIIKKIDRNQKHGGNYKKEEDAVDETLSTAQKHQIIPRKIDGKPKSINDQEKADDVEIIKDFDETKKHGGNYKADEEAQATASISLLNKANNVLKVQRDNFKRKLSSTTTTTTEAALLVSESPKDDVEIVGDFDEDKKTGGNYKSEEDALKTEDYAEEDSSVEAEVTVMPKISDVPFPNKIRRTVKRKAVVADAANPQKIQKPKEEVEVLADFDETHKHGGNLRLPEEATKTTEKAVTEKTTAYPAPSKTKKQFRRSTTQSTPADPIVVSTSKNRNYEVEVVEPYERSRRRSRPYNEERRSSYSEDTVYPRPSKGNRASKPTRHFRRKVSVTSVVKNTVILRPKEPEPEVEDNYEERRNHESSRAETTTEAATTSTTTTTTTTTTPKVEVAASVDAQKKTDESNKAASEENKDSTPKETSTAKKQVEKNSQEVSNKTTATPQSNTHAQEKNNKPESSNVEVVSTTTPAAEFKVVKPKEEKKKHVTSQRVTKKVNQSTTARATTTTSTTTTTTTTTTEAPVTSKPAAVKKHVRRKVSVSSEVSNKNTVTQKPKEEVEVVKDYDKNKKHGGNYKSEESSAEETAEETTIAPKEDVEVVGPMDEEKKHGGNYNPARKYHFNDDVSFIVEETSFPKYEDSPANTVKKQFRRKVYVNGEVFGKNGVNDKPKEEVEVMKDYDKAKKHGGNLKAESTASEDVEQTTLPPKAEVEVVGPVDEDKKHGGNYKPADDDVADGEIPIEAAESAHPAISQIPAVNAIKQHTRRRATISKETPNHLTSVETPKEEVEIFKDYDETEKHGGNYGREEAEELEATTTTTTARSTLGTTSTSRRHSRRKSTSRASTTTTAAPDTKAEASKEDAEERKTEVKTTRPTVSLTRPARSQRTRGRTRNIVASQLGRVNDAEVMKDYDKTKQHGGNYKAEETTTSRGRARQNNNNNKAEDVEVFAQYNHAQKTGGNYRRQQRTTTTTTTTEPTPAETSVPPTAYEQQEDFDEIEQLTDAVPKPFSFYSDSKLPDKVNHLDDSSSNESNADSSTDDYLVGEESRTPITTTNTPFFIKDPRKRKYFYAPVK